MRILSMLAALTFSVFAVAQNPNAIGTFPGEEKMNYATDIETGAQQVKEYLPLLKGKRVCILSNHTGMVTETTHILDTLLSKKINVFELV